MPTTLIEGPKGFDSEGNSITPYSLIGTNLNDGVNYNVTNTFLNRFLQDPIQSINTVAVANVPAGYLYTNFFHAGMPIERQIPEGKIITGVEVVAGTDFDGNGNSYIGSFGTNASSWDVRCYLHNGNQYSAPLTWDSSDSYDGITLIQDNTAARFNGGNKRYKNADLGDDVLFGGPNDLSGLEWDPVNQSNFGLAFTFRNRIGGAMVGGFIRGIGLRITYEDPPPPQSKIIITGGTKVNIKKTTQTSTDYSYAIGHGAGGGVGFPQNTEYLLPENNGEVIFPAGDIYNSNYYISLGGFDWEDEIFPSNAVFDSITIKYSVKRQSATEIGTTRLIYKLKDDSNNIVNKLSVPFSSDDNYYNIEDTITSPNLSFNFFNNFQQIQFFWTNTIADTDTEESANNDYDNGFLYINGNEGFDPQIKINYTIPSPIKVILGS